MHQTGPILGLMGVLAAGLAITGCDQTKDENGAPSTSPYVTAEELAGSWEQTASWGAVNLQFGDDGMLLRFIENNEGTHRAEGSWAIDDGGRLIRELTSTELGTGWSRITTETDRSLPEIDGDHLHLNVLVRVDGDSGESLGGTWELENLEHQEIQSERDGVQSTSAEERLFTLQLEVTGDEVRALEEETTTLEEDGTPETYYERTTKRGTLRRDGDQLFVTWTTIESRPVPEDDQVEVFFGWRLSDDAIDLETNADEDPAATAFVRQ